jgi:hypothetical protein
MSRELLVLQSPELETFTMPWVVHKSLQEHDVSAKHDSLVVNQLVVRKST